MSTGLETCHTSQFNQSFDMFLNLKISYFPRVADTFIIQYRGKSVLLIRNPFLERENLLKSFEIVLK